MSLKEFEDFHKEVLNLPRDSFTNFDIQKIKSLGEYLFSIKRSFPHDGGLKLTNIYIEIHIYLKSATIAHPNNDFESLFNLNLSEVESVKQHYTKVGRRFRHWMELASLLGLLMNAKKGSGRVLSEFAEEIYLIPSTSLKTLLRNKILSINVLDNPGLNNLKSSYLYKNLNFRPAMAIIKYLSEMARECTKFELSIFFGRPNYLLNSEDDIVKSALEVGKKFPLNQDKQIQYYFDLRGWKDEDGYIYEYSPSQQPYFKFNAFFILMEAVGLVRLGLKKGVIITDFSKSLFSTSYAPELVELEALIDEVEKIDSNDKIANKIANNRSKIIGQLLQSDKKFLERVNLKASNKSGLIQSRSSATNRLKRDTLITEISKEQVKYTCQGCEIPTFQNKNNNNYVESHHIIEYNKKEEGPDVLQNLLVLCPNCHSKIHFARLDVVDSFYKGLRASNAITLDQFKEIHTKFSMLKIKHINILNDKKIINNSETKELLDLIK